MINIHTRLVEGVFHHQRFSSFFFIILSKIQSILIHISLFENIFLKIEKECLNLIRKLCSHCNFKYKYARIH